MLDISEYRGRTAVITGAASGMGLCASRRLCAAGANVVMCDINGEALVKLADEITSAGPGRAFACVADVRKFADAQQAAALAVEKTGRIDLLVTFAGGYEPRMCNTPGIPFYEQPIKVIDWGIDVNLKGAIYFARACMPQMVKAGKGVICCLGSVTGFEGDGYGAMYGTAKSGLFNFVKGLAIAGAPYGVRAVCVTPGPILSRPGMASMPTLMRRAGELDELVDAILFLCSENASFITGSNHVVDGGRLCMYQKTY